MILEIYRNTILQLFLYQEAITGGFLDKEVLLKNSQNSQEENTYAKASAFPWILQNL